MAGSLPSSTGYSALRRVEHPVDHPDGPTGSFWADATDAAT